MYAVIETGGKQVKVSEGSVIYVEKLDVEAGSTYTFDKVLMVGGEELTVGNPYVDGVTVEATVDKQGKQKENHRIQNETKEKYRRKQGHRQPYTKLTVTKINK